MVELSLAVVVEKDLLFDRIAVFVVQGMVVFGHIGAVQEVALVDRIVVQEDEADLVHVGPPCIVGQQVW